MSMRKTFRGGTSCKNDARSGDGIGTFRAVIATIGAIDADKDVVTKETFRDGWRVPVSAFGHRHDLPAIGKATIRVEPTAVPPIVCAEGMIFLDVAHGLDAWRSMRGLAGLQQWSWSFELKRSHRGQVGGQACRFLDEIELLEVCPVLAGASVGTTLVFAKGTEGGNEFARLAAQELLSAGWKGQAGAVARARGDLRALDPASGARDIAQALDHLLDDLLEGELKELQQRLEESGYPTNGDELRTRIAATGEGGHSAAWVDAMVAIDLEGRIAELQREYCGWGPYAEQVARGVVGRWATLPAGAPVRFRL